jgi:hypothetical protein
MPGFRFGHHDLHEPIEVPVSRRRCSAIFVDRYLVSASIALPRPVFGGCVEVLEEQVFTRVAKRV